MCVCVYNNFSSQKKICLSFGYIIIIKKVFSVFNDDVGGSGGKCPGLSKLFFGPIFQSLNSQLKKNESHDYRDRIFFLSIFFESKQQQQQPKGKKIEEGICMFIIEFHYFFLILLLLQSILSFFFSH